MDQRCGLRASGDWLDEEKVQHKVRLAHIDAPERRQPYTQRPREALGDKRGIQRYGFLLPMDEAQARVGLDLGGRPYAVFEGEFPRERVGELPTELVPHFFRSLAESLRAAIHIQVAGENAHHMVEACFKGVARSLGQALRRDGSDVPSTKGVL